MNQNNHDQIIHQFYSSFAAGNVEGMISCYHEEVVFEDPAFGVLKGDRAKQMWKMLLTRKNASPKVTFKDVSSTSDQGAAHWRAEYQYGPEKRKVINEIEARFVFKDGKIIQHVETFDLWKWTQQALGIPGYLLGWTSYMKNKIQKTTNALLDEYISQSK